VQTLDQGWAMTTLSHRDNSDVQKNVIYAFPTLKDVTLGPYPMHDPQMIALPVPVTHILFQMLAIESVDSTIFFELPGSMVVGTEIQREELNQLIQSSILGNQGSSTRPLPPDIA